MDIIRAGSSAPKVRKMRYAYIRVSTAEQNEARQYEALKNCGIDRYFAEKASGKNTDRPAFKRLMRLVRSGDTVFVEDFSRLARSTEDLLKIVRVLQRKEVSLISLKENLDTASPTGKLMLTMIAAINEFERANMLERQREGIEIAKANGVYKGRKRIDIPEDIGVYHSLWEAGKMSKAAIARALGVSRPTCDRFFREYLNGGAIIRQLEKK